MPKGDDKSVCDHVEETESNHPRSGGPHSAMFAMRTMAIEWWRDVWMRIQLHILIWCSRTLLRLVTLLYFRRMISRHQTTILLAMASKCNKVGREIFMGRKRVPDRNKRGTKR